MSEPPQRRVRDRDVLVLLALVVVAVIGANVVAAYVPAVETILSRAPLVVVLLIVVTALVLVRALRGRRPAA